MIDKKQIDHLAKLSRISIESAEIKSFQKQIDEILNFVAILQKVDTTGIKPGFYLDEQSKTRTDEIKASVEQKDILDAMPQVVDGLLKTPKIFS